MKGSVAVLMGGPSAEYAISLKSGRGVTEALASKGWLAKPMVIPRDLNIQEALTWTRESMPALSVSAAFIALHGTFGEDGTIQLLCEELELPYTGSGPEASRIGMDKAVSRMRFEEAGLFVPKWKRLYQGDKLPDLESWIFPLIVKPNGQGSSIGISRVDEAAALPKALKGAWRYGPSAILEEWVTGREVTAGILNHKALPVVEIVPKHAWFDFEAKYTQGLTEYVCPAPLDAATTRAVQRAGWIAHQAIGGRHFSRTDIILSNGRPIVLEVNTIPGFTPLSLLPKAAAAAGISYEELCDQLVMLALASRKEESGASVHRG